MKAPHLGWHLAAHLDELPGEITPLSVGSQALIAVRDGASVRIFDGTCPHRGAHLGFGGRLVRDCVICPFHGKAIHLGERAAPRYGVAEHPTLVAGQAVFVRLGAEDRGFTAALDTILDGRVVSACARYEVSVPGELVIENAFDVDHFVAVHATARAEMVVVSSTAGELAADGRLHYRPRPDMDLADAGHRSLFLARAYSPTLVASEIGQPGSSHVVITGTVPTPTGCTARVVYAVRRRPDGAPPHPAMVAALKAGGDDAFAEDQLVWEHLDPDAPARFDARDSAVLAFRRFCAAFPGTAFPQPAISQPALPQPAISQPAISHAAIHQPAGPPTAAPRAARPAAGT